MKKIFSLSLALLLVVGMLPVTIFAAEKTIVSEIVATYDFVKPTYGQEITKDGFTFTVQGGIPVTITMEGFDWYKYDDEYGWSDVDDGYFTDGLWYHDVYVELTDTENYEIDPEGATLIINGVEWEELLYDLGSWIASPTFEIEFVAEVLPLALYNPNSYSVSDSYLEEPIYTYSFASGAIGGTKPYTFSKTGGPDWIQVSENGVISGTPTVTGENDDLVITVTDALGATASLEVLVYPTYINPADRQVVSRVVGTVDIPAYVCGDEFIRGITTNVTEGTGAQFRTRSSDYYPVLDEEGNLGDSEYYAYYGKFVMDVYVAIEDDAGHTHVLDDENLEVIINGQPTTYDYVSVSYDYSYAWVTMTVPFMVEHDFDNDTDATCNGCDYTREGCDHQYSEECDETCDVCGASRVGDHIYSYDCDAECNMCGKIRVPADHVYDSCDDAWCDECGEEREPLDCVYSDCDDAECDVCSKVRYAPVHTYTNILDTECTECGDTRELKYIKAGDTKEIEIHEGEYIDFVFECKATGFYNFTSDFEDVDTLGEAFDKDGNSMIYDDDGFDNRQFWVYANFQAGKTYVLRARSYFDYESGIGTVSLTPDFEIANPIMHFMVGEDEWYSCQVEAGTIILPPANPTKEGLSFMGWFTEDDEYFDVEITPIYEDITLYAKFGYAVAFCFDIDNIVAWQVVEHGDTAEEIAEPAQEGKDFLGWYTEVEGGVKFDFENTPITGNINLYARFEDEASSVKYGDVDASGEVDATDALVALHISVGKIIPTDAQKTAADVDFNGEVEATDALLILHYSVGKITSFVGEE